MSQSNGQGIVLFDAQGQPASKSEYVRVQAAQRAINELLKNDRNLQENLNRLLTALNSMAERIESLEADRDARGAKDPAEDFG